MNKVERIYKVVGLTPLQAIEQFRKENSELKDIKLSYMGRLDPMAEGEMLVLIGEENKNRDKYLNLNKEYEFDVLFGLKTDTFDILGMVSCGKDTEDDFKAKLEKEIEKLKGKHEQEYPPYSSPKVKGKKLFEWARLGRLKEIKVPIKEVEIYDIEIVTFYVISKNDLSRNVFERINLVSGDFRQEEILKRWVKELKECKINLFKVAKIAMKCSSGTYARSIANGLGEKLGTGALALNIKRTRI